MNDLINQVEYQAGAQQRAQQILQTVQPSTSLSTSARTPPRPRSAPVRRTSPTLERAAQILQNVQPSTDLSTTSRTTTRARAATRIQSAVRGAQAKKEMRNRSINEASRENQMQAAANRFNAKGEQM